MILKIGTDCSGIETPIQALEKLKIKYRHMFSSEKDKFAKETLLANFKPEIFFDDMTVKRSLPKLDIYVCGFPCQSHSLAGLRLGSEDVRSSIFIHCIKTIIDTEPTLFILENVKGILSSNGGEYWSFVKKELNKLKEYNIKCFILNTKDYGIPQNRERLYIVGIKKSKQLHEINEPRKIKSRPITDYVEDTGKTRGLPDNNICRKYLNKIKQHKGTFIDLNFLKYTSPNSYETYSPTIMTNNYMWCIPMNRKATMKELLSLQGLPKNFKQVVSDTQMKKQIGNSMSVNVLVHLFKECFKNISF
jgi:DNA (cytosine-5)-methyltransferase 1